VPNSQSGPADSLSSHQSLPSRQAELSPERFESWIAAFGRRHGGLIAEPGPGVVTFRAADGAVARCVVPFPPLTPTPAVPPGEAAAQLAAHALAARNVGVLLVRLGGYAAGVFTGDTLAAAKVGSRLVHGRSAAGGTSQRRFARRRENQAHQALAAAADTAAAVFSPYAGRLDAVVLGGDRRAIAGLREDPRLRPFFELATERFLTVPNPRLTVLRSAPALFRAIRITVTEPGRLS
jgi:hypothetical protein